MADSMIASRHSWLLILPLLLLATWLGARGLSADAVWYDEYFSVVYAGGGTYGPVSLAETWQRVAQPTHELNPPGYYLLLNLWGRLVGWTEYAARALALLAGVLAIAWMYRLGRDMFSHPVGLSAAVALGASAFFIHFLHEIRSYTLFTLAIVICVWCYWRMVRGKTNAAAQLAFLLSAIALLYTHYITWLTLVAIGSYHLLFVPRTRMWWRVWVLLALSVVAFLPWVGSVIQGITHLQANLLRRVIVIDAATALQMLVYAFSNGSVAMLTLVAGYGLLARGRGATFVRLWVGSVLVLSLMVNLWLEYLLHVRYLFTLWPALALLVGLGIASLAGGGVRPSWVLAIWIGAGIWNSADPAFMYGLRTVKPLPFHVMHRVLVQRAQPGDAVAFDAPDYNWNQTPILEYYTGGLPVQHKVIEDLPGKEGEEEFYLSARQFIAGAPRVWYGIETDLAPNFRRAEFERALAADYVSCGTVFDIPDMRLLVYARIPDAPAPFRFGEDITLRLLEPLASTQAETLTVLQGWSTSPDVPAYTYSAALHVVNAADELVAQADYGLPLGAFSCQPTDIALNGLPPGEYRLLTAVYDWKTGERLPGQVTNRDKLFDRVPLGSFTKGG